MAGLIEMIHSNRRKVGEGLYLLYFAVMVGARAAGLYEGKVFYNICLVVGLLLFAAKIVVTHHTVKEYAIMAAFFVLAILVYKCTGEKGLFVCFTMMFGMKYVCPRKVILTGAAVAGFFVFGKIILGVFGIIPEIYYPQERAGAGLMFRHAFGYAHPNTLHMNVLMLTMMVLYLATLEVQARSEDDKHSLSYLYIASSLALFFNLYIFMYSGSRTGLIACMVYIVCNLWLAVRKNIGLFEKIVAFAAFPVTCVVSVILPLVLPEDIFHFLNKTVFNSRFSLAKYFWTNNHLSLFGIRLNNPDPTLKTYGIDMAQMYLLLQLGLVAFVVMAALTVWYIAMAIKRGKRAELAVTLAMLFLGMWEPLLYNLGFKNFIYVFMGQMFFMCLNDSKAAAPDELKTGKTGCCAASSEAGDACADSEESPQGDLGFKTFIKSLAGAIFAGIAASLIFLLATAPPTALYGDREEGENGVSFGMTAEYLTSAEVSQLKKNGDIIIGYVDEKTPMYRYGEEIALMEYQKKSISIGVWIGILAMLIISGYHYRRQCSNKTGNVV